MPMPNHIIIHATNLYNLFFYIHFNFYLLVDDNFELYKVYDKDDDICKIAFIFFNPK